MKRDIENREDIILLVNEFYTKIEHDPVIGHYFTKIAHVDWGKHLPIMYDFWQTLLFPPGPYRGSVMDKHFALNAADPMEKPDFQEWLKLWKETVEEHFQGQMAETAIKKAENIAVLMEFKMSQAANTSKKD